MQAIQRYVIFAYLGFGVLLWQSLSRLLGWIASLAEVANPSVIGNNFLASNLIGLALAVAVGVALYKYQRAKSFSEEVITELMKVAWPTRKETQSATVVVIITTLIIAAMLGVFDLVWGQITGFIYHRL